MRPPSITQILSFERVDKSDQQHPRVPPAARLERCVFDPLPSRLRIAGSPESRIGRRDARSHKWHQSPHRLLQSTPRFD